MISLSDRVLAHLEQAAARGRRWSTVPMIAREMWMPTVEIGAALVELVARREVARGWPGGANGEVRYALPRSNEARAAE